MLISLEYKDAQQGSLGPNKLKMCRYGKKTPKLEGTEGIKSKQSVNLPGMEQVRFARIPPDVFHRFFLRCQELETDNYFGQKAEHCLQKCLGSIATSVFGAMNNLI